MLKKKINLTTELITVVAFFVLFAIVLLVFQLLVPSFLSSSSITTMLKNVSTTAIAALGLTFVIIVGHSDISFYLTSCFSGMLMAWIVSIMYTPMVAAMGSVGASIITCFVAVLAGLISGAIWGAMSGMAVGKFHFPDKIATIAIGSIGFGLAYIFSDGAFIYTNMTSSGITNLSELRILGLTVSGYIMILFYVVAFIVLDLSKHGRNFYAVGANKKSAFFSGIKVNRYVIIAFIVSGTLAAMAAMINNASQGQGNVNSGSSLLMPCFSAVYIGYAVFRKPCVVGTLCGALLATVITTGFTALSVAYYYSDLVMALVLLLAIGLSKLEIKPMVKKAPVVATTDDSAKTNTEVK